MVTATLKMPTEAKRGAKEWVVVIGEPIPCRRGFEPIRYLPKEVAILRGLIHEAWILVHRMTASGMKFAGTLEQATLTIAGCAYAAWRNSYELQSDPAEEWVHTEMASGFAEGIMFAITHPEGMPRRYAEDYPDSMREGGPYIIFDGKVPLDVLSKYWPDDYTPTGLKLAPPKLMELRHGDLGLEAQLHNPQPNILTTKPEEVERARFASEKRFDRLIHKAM